MIKLDCELNTIHKDECRILARGSPPVFKEDEPTEAYHCILPLRLVLLSRSDPEKYDLVRALMDHEEERCKGEDWKTTERTVVQHILDNCKARDIEKFTEQELRRAIGVLEVNSYEVHSFVRHIWNTEPPYTNTCIATVDIEAGTEVITSYAAPTECSLFRRKKFEDGWYFTCLCERCKSADELGTEFNTIRCTQCTKPELRMADTNNTQSDWSCSACNKSESYESVRERISGLFNKIKQISLKDRYSMESWLNILEETEKIVHSHHAAIIEICKWLLPILCRAADKQSEEYPVSLMEKKLQLSRIYREVLDVIDPGISKSRAKALYENLETDIFLTMSRGISVSEIKVQKWIQGCQQIVFIFNTLGQNPGFESIMFRNAGTIIQRLQLMVKTYEQLEKRGLMNGTAVQEFKEQWSFLELWRWQPC